MAQAIPVLTAHAEPVARLRYEPALDGLRGLAVLAVIGYHAMVGPLGGGFIGVDVFFVLSGYLITALLLAEHAETGRIDTLAFYARRARRLLPALVLLLLGVALYSEFVAFSGDRMAIRSDALASLFYVQNWHLVWAKASYFTAFDAPSPLRHVWSLAIEEQFYLVWPIALMLLLKVTKRRRWVLVAAIGTAALASAILMGSLYKTGLDPSRVYYGTDTRAQELLVGALLAALLTRSRSWAPRVSRYLQVAGFVGAATLLWAVTRVSDQTTLIYRGGFFGIAIATSAVIAAVTCANTGRLHEWLSVRPLRATGRISYGLYLWHWPVLLWLDPDRTGLHGWLLLALRVAVTFALAMLSYVVVERPVRAGAVPIWRGKRLALMTTVAVVSIPIAFSAPVLISEASLATEVPAAAAATPRISGPATPTTTPGQRARVAARLAKDAGWAPGDRDVQVDGKPLANGPIFVPGLDRDNGRAHIVMVGDSVLYTLVRPFDPGPTSRADYYNYPEIGCSFMPGNPIEGNGLGTLLPACSVLETRWRMLVERRHPDLSFLLVGAWEVFDYKIDSREYRVGTAAFAEKLRAVLNHDVDLFSSHGGLVALPTVPCFDPPDYGVAGAANGGEVRRDRSRIAVVNSVIRAIARARPDVVRIVDLASFLCPDGRARDHIGGVKIRVDGVHFTPEGADIVARWLAPRLEALVPTGPVFAAAQGNG